MIIDKKTERLHQYKTAMKEIKKKNEVEKNGYPKKNQNCKSQVEINKFIENEKAAQNSDDTGSEYSQSNQDPSEYLSLKSSGDDNIVNNEPTYDSDDSDSDYSVRSQLTIELSDIDLPADDLDSQHTTIIHESGTDSANSETGSQCSSEDSLISSNESIFFKENFNKNADEERYQIALSEQLQHSDEFPSKHKKEFNPKSYKSNLFKGKVPEQPEPKGTLSRKII